MSKRSRRRLGREGRQGRDADKATAPARPGPSVAALTTPAAPRGRFRFRRYRLAIMVLLVGAAGFLVTKLQATPRMGVLEYNSDDPTAQVILEKEGEEIPLKQGLKYSMPLEPGHYTTRLATPAKDLKLPSFINLDPNGRAFLTIRRKSEETGQTPAK